MEELHREHPFHRKQLHVRPVLHTIGGGEGDGTEREPRVWPLHRRCALQQGGGGRGGSIGAEQEPQFLHGPEVCVLSGG